MLRLTYGYPRRLFVFTHIAMCFSHSSDEEVWYNSTAYKWYNILTREPHYDCICCPSYASRSPECISSCMFLVITILPDGLEHSLNAEAPFHTSTGYKYKYRGCELDVQSSSPKHCMNDSYVKIPCRCLTKSRISSSTSRISSASP